MARTPVNVTVTGAAGQIGYALLFRIASGQLLGAGRPGEAAAAGDHAGAQGRRGHRDGARRLRVPAARRHRHHRRRADAPSTASTSRCSSAPARARPGMERGDLLEANGGIFKPQGEAINAGAADDVRVLVVGNPANTNALIAASHAPDVPGRPLHRDDPPRPQPRADPAGQEDRPPVADIRRLTIWGNHSATQYPDIFHAEIAGKNAAEVVDDRTWLENDFIPTVAKRGAAIIDARGASSAASAANAAIDHVYDWVNGTPEGDWTCAAIVSDGSYGVPEGLISSFPVVSTRRALGDRPGPGHRRLLAGAHRRVGRGAGGGARRRVLPRPASDPPAATRTRTSRGETRGEDQGGEPGRRARRRRDDPDHLGVHQGPADPPVPRRRPRVLRPRHRAPRRHRRPGDGRRGQRHQAARRRRQVRDDHAGRGAGRGVRPEEDVALAERHDPQHPRRRHLPRADRHLEHPAAGARLDQADRHRPSRARRPVQGAPTSWCPVPAR